MPIFLPDDSCNTMDHVPFASSKVRVAELGHGPLVRHLLLAIIDRIILLMFPPRHTDSRTRPKQRQQS